MTGKIKWDVQDVLDAATKAVKPNSGGGRQLLGQLKEQAQKLGRILPGRR